MQHKRSAIQILFCGLGLVLVLMACSSIDKGAGASSNPKNGGISNITHTTPQVNQDSTISFTLSGGNTGRYTVHASLPTSKLRHGHKEFTIDVEQGEAAVFLVFYGYDGPATYTLAQNINGGDIHIALAKNAASWDLSLEPKAQCSITVQSITPIQNTNLARMQGTFACPRLFSSTPNHPARSITVSNGSFDIAIIIES